MIVRQPVVDRIASDGALDRLVRKRDHPVVHGEAHRADSARWPHRDVFNERPRGECGGEELLAPLRDRLDEIRQEPEAGDACRYAQAFTRTLLKQTLVVCDKPRDRIVWTERP